MRYNLCTNRVGTTFSDKLYVFDEFGYVFQLPFDTVKIQIKGTYCNCFNTFILSDWTPALFNSITNCAQRAPDLFIIDIIYIHSIIDYAFFE